jgi:hypothetical protein
MSDPADRRTNDALRRRVDGLLGRVSDARAEIVERGLDAVRGPEPYEPDPSDSASRGAAERPAGDG